jgi:hypothetical protein
MDDAEKIKFYERKLRNSEKGSRAYMEALIELRNISGSGYSVPSGTDDQPMANDPSEAKPEKSSKMMDGGMAKGKGGKMYQHNYATGGSVTDHLSKVVGPPMGQPQSVQAATATMGETPAQRSKRLRSGG